MMHDGARSMRVSCMETWKRNIFGQLWKYGMIGKSWDKRICSF
jgi:hypothetical protein